VCFEVRLKESSDGDTLMAAGIWFQIWGAAVMGASSQRQDITQQDAVTWLCTSETAYFSVWKKILYFITHV